MNMIVKYGVQVAAICMISLVVFTLYVSQSGCSCIEVDEERLTVQIGSPEVSKRLSGEEAIWDGILTIDKVTPKDEKARWVKMRVVVKS
ncbi:MAG: hypothetical protein KAX80_10770, partial [Planctomycetes bacterium]|nr:hypothetical protein [Planctomycetota bacterium]